MSNSNCYLRFVGQAARQSRGSIVVSIPACHAGDPGSIPGNGVFFFVFANKLFHSTVNHFIWEMNRTSSIKVCNSIAIDSSNLVHEPNESN